MLKRIQVYIKKKHPTLYKWIRTQLFGLESRRLRKAREFTSRTIATVSYGGYRFKIVLDPRNGFVDQTIFANQVYEPDILSVIKEHLESGDTFVDIGANIGQHSLFAACVVGKNGTVIAFEPLSSVADQFSQSVSHNNFNEIIRVINQGCGAVNETVSINTNPLNIGGSSVHVMPSHGGSAETITLIPPDTVLQEYPRVHFIKIDTEGHEYEVIKGLQKTILRDHPKILLEFSPSFRNDISGYDILLLLESEKYTFYDLENGHSKIEDPKRWAFDFKKIQTNLLCLPTE